MTAVTQSGLTGFFFPPKRTRSGPVPGRGGGKKNPVRSGARWAPPGDRGDRTGTVPVGSPVGFIPFRRNGTQNQNRDPPTGLIGGLVHLKIETRLIDEKIANALGEYVT